MNKTAEYWIEKLQLQEHPEGGYYRETYRSKEGIQSDFLPDRFEGGRQFLTSIYFLLKGDNFSAFHRLKSDEIWYFHAGCSLTVHIINPQGIYDSVQLGDDGDQDEQFQVMIPANHWFAATLNHPDSYTLVGCSVAPGFEFQDFELGWREILIQQYPQHQVIIEKLTRI